MTEGEVNQVSLVALATVLLRHFTLLFWTPLLLALGVTVVGVVAIYYLLIGNQRSAAKAVAKQINEQRLKVTSAERLVAATAEPEAAVARVVVAAGSSVAAVAPLASPVSTRPTPSPWPTRTAA